MKVYDIPKSGKRGRIVAFQSRYGQCERAHTPSAKPRTAAQLRSQAHFGAASAGWNYLTDEQRNAWRAYGRTVRSHPRGGQSGPLSGQTLYTAINRNQAALGLPPLDYPPERPSFGPNPVVALDVSVVRNRVVLQLILSGTPTGDLLVFASRPYNAGRQYCDKFLYIGPLRTPVAGRSNITAQYLKLQGMPWPGSRVIISTVQQRNGWRDLPRRIEAVFPPAQAPAPQPRRRRAAPAAP
jgi:hypothetical protein